MLRRVRRTPNSLSQAVFIVRREFSKKKHPTPKYDKTKGHPTPLDEAELKSAVEASKQPPASVSQTPPHRQTQLPPKTGTPPPPPPPSSTSTPSQGSGPFGLSPTQMRIATGVLLVAGAGYLIWDTNSPSPPPPPKTDSPKNEWNDLEAGVKEEGALDQEVGVVEKSEMSEGGVTESVREEIGGFSQESEKSEEGEKSEEPPVVIDLGVLDNVMKEVVYNEVAEEKGEGTGSTAVQKESTVEAAGKQEDVSTSSKDASEPTKTVLPTLETENLPVVENSTVDAQKAIPPVETLAHTKPKSLEEPPEVTDDLNVLAGLLVDEATKGGAGAGEDWVKFGAMHQQAESDAGVFIKWKEMEIQKQKAEQSGQLAEISQLKSRIDRMDQQKAKYRKEMENTMQRQQKLADEQREGELKRQADFLALAAAEAAVQERVDRAKQMDEVRLKLGSLTEVFAHQSEQAQTSHHAHKIVMGILALEQSLKTGEPCAEALGLLKNGCGDDPVTMAVLTTLPKEVAERGVPTLPQLCQRFVDVKGKVLALGMLPEQGGGLLSQAVAKVGAFLKVPETGFAASGVSRSNGASALDSVVAQVESELNDGSVVAAVRRLEERVSGGPAEVGAQDWLRDAKNRAAVEQTLRFLQARAFSLTASLV